MTTNKTRWLLAGLLFLALWPGVARGQSLEFMDAYNQSSELYAQGRYQEALPFAKKALGLSEEEFGPYHLGTASSLNILAALYWAQGDYAEAELLLKRALAILEKALGPAHPDVAKGLNNLGELYRAQGR
ncbi:MAG: tetratricopeptide repeat protein, partial [Planctomycetota bacterium]